MRIIILGSAAGGGVPQWNCRCPNCIDARHDARGRTQSSVAVSAAGGGWGLLNAPPDLPLPLPAPPGLLPPPPRGAPPAPVLVTGAGVDHTPGVLPPRVGTPRPPGFPHRRHARLRSDGRGGGRRRAPSGWGCRSLAVRRYVLVGRRAHGRGRRRADGARDGAPSSRWSGWQLGAAAAARGEAGGLGPHQQHESDLVSQLRGAGAGRGGRHCGGRGRDGVRAVSTRVSPSATAELVGRLRGVLERRYHHLHPFNQRMHRGELSRDELRLWVANRFYYQISIPIKDALILSSCPEREVRQQWIQRIIDHDGRPGEEGGIEAWLRLGEAMGVKREDLVGQRFLLPGVRFAVDAYVSFCRFRPWLEAVAASLTEMFAPLIVKERLAGVVG